MTATSLRTFDGNAAPFVFVSVFKWEWRKGWDLLLDAFGASLVVATTKVLLKLNLLTVLEQRPRDLGEHIGGMRGKSSANRAKLPAIELLLADITREGMRDLCAHSDAFVLPAGSLGPTDRGAMSMGHRYRNQLIRSYQPS